MSNASTSAERRYEQACKEAMARAKFSHVQKQEWFIWAAIHRPCPTCSSAPHERCWNMAKLRYHQEHVGVRWPHDDRVDWPKMYEGLIQRGYIIP